MRVIEDKLGREINEGDICVVATSDQAFTFGKVSQV